MLPSETILRQINDFLNQIFINPVVLSMESNAQETAEWDSVAQIQLLILVEEHYGFSFGFGEADSLQNVSELVALIQRKTGNELARNPN